jgi:hypothetical protein
VIQNKPNVNHPPSKFDSCDQPAPIMAYIKNDKTPDYIGVFPTVPNVSEVRPIRVPGDLVPGI